MLCASFKAKEHMVSTNLTQTQDVHCPGVWEGHGKEGNALLRFSGSLANLWNPYWHHIFVHAAEKLWKTSSNEVVTCLLCFVHSAQVPAGFDESKDVDRLMNVTSDGQKMRLALPSQVNRQCEGFDCLLWLWVWPGLICLCQETLQNWPRWQVWTHKPAPVSAVVDSG